MPETDILRTSEDRFADLPDFDYDPQYVDVGSADGPNPPGGDGEVRMAYVEAGSGAETFLLLHGEPTYSFLYRKMIPGLAERGRVVVPDFVGFGRSDKYTDREAYSYRQQYDALESFVAELDLADVTLVGQDWGGILGLPYAAANPDRVARLVAMNTGLPDGTQQMADEWHQFREFVESVDELQVGTLVANGCATDLPEEVVAAYDAPFPDEASKAGARAWPALVPTDPDDGGADAVIEARERLAEWDEPAFVLFASGDPITRGARDELRDLIPTASDQPDVWIDGAAHFLQEDRGEEVAEEIVGFVDRT